MSKIHWVERKAKKEVSDFDSIQEKICKIRGIDEPSRFFSPTENELFDPNLLKNVDLVIKRITKAIENKDKVCISFDCDVDGITSGVITYRYLKEYIGEENLSYIYSERGDGHGINEQIDLDFVKKKHIDEDGEIIGEARKERYELNSENIQKIKDSDLLIIVDSSTNDADGCKKIKEEYKTDVLIIDHHEVENENEYAVIVNPKQNGCKYPNKELSGAGVVYKVLTVLEESLGEAGNVNVEYFSDLVALGMYADVMPVDVYENRYLIMHGLRNIKNVGVKRILKGAKEDLFKLNSDSIGFSIAPLINGVARLNQIKLAIDILLTDDDDVAKKIRLKMHKLNEKRKIMQKEIIERYESMLDINHKIILISDDESSKGFNGLVAQNLASKYQRPVIVGRDHSGNFSGSFRSINSFNLKEFLSNSGLTEEVMGHNQAGGFTIKSEKIDELVEYIEENMPDLSETEQYYTYDFELSPQEIDDDLIKVIEYANLVTGNRFPKIVVRVNDILIESVNTIGKTMETRKFKTLGNLEMIKFKVSENYAREVNGFDSLDVIGDLSNNEWYNFKTKVKTITPQIKILDYKKQ
jgi:single-stranded-DNA-specific exonuclease